MGARILTLDIETSPAIGAVWGQYRQNLYNDGLLLDPRMICFAAKWLDENRTLYFSEYDFATQQQSEKKRAAMLQAAFDLLDEADGLITYNGDDFDIPHLTREFIENGLGEPSPFVSIDLYRTVKKVRWFSRKLDYVGQRVTGRGKVDNGGMPLWLDCMSADPQLSALLAGRDHAKAWRKMRTYNRRDVVLTEEVYYSLRPIIKKHPNLALYRDEVPLEPICPRCDSEAVYRRGWAYTSTGRYPRLYCPDCGKWSKGKKNEGIAELRVV